jgi:ATP phosphoribosyltransferase
MATLLRSPTRKDSYSGVDSDTQEQMLFAVPKKGRLYSKVCEILGGAGVDFIRPNRLDVAKCTSLPLTLVFLPAADIALYVSDGKVDMGITGIDLIEESQAKVNVDMKLGFGKCRLCLQAPVADKVQSAQELVGKRIVTSFTNLAKKYFHALPGGEKTQISYVSGSVEAACGLGLADGIVDLVETGTTMMAAGLEIIDVVLPTETVLISRASGIDSPYAELQKKLVQRFTGYLTAQKYNMMVYNVKEEHLEAAKKITPGLKAPTVMKLLMDDEEWYAIQVMTLKTKTNDIMDALSDIGANGIFVMDIKNCRI